MEDYQGASQLTLTELNNEVQIEQQFILLSISDQDIVFKHTGSVVKVQIKQQFILLSISDQDMVLSTQEVF